MNSYNENLHSSVVSSLNAQELELQKLKSQVDASTFSMYYAQGARITAAEKLELTNNKYLFQQKVNNQAVGDSDMSTNVLTSATNAKTYVSKSVSNTAVAAANVQIATNAIVKLASDTGSIFSIVNAADFGTDIYHQAEQAKDLMNTTAYLAERTSQDSMEASSYVAQISVATLADKATVADTSIKNLLGAVSAQLDDTTTELSTETANLTAANTEEKKTEGNLEDVNVLCHASNMAYTLTNKQLNLGLTVLPEDDAIGDETNYTVNFNKYRAPFKGLISEKTPNNTEDDAKKHYNPVENYYIMLAKNSKQDTFSISEAEALVAKDDESQYIEIPQEEFESISTENLISQKIFTSELKDSDGDKMALGSEYVIFIYAEFRINYKKIINTFDNYLSAASAKFSLTNQLNTVETSSILVTPNGSSFAVLTPSTDSSDSETKKTPESQVLSFQVWEDIDYAVAYRCMFLPNNKGLVCDLLTVEGLQSIESEAEAIEKIADKFDPKIADLSAKITSLQAEKTGITSQIKTDKAALKANKAQQKKKSTTPEMLAELKKEQAKLEANILHLEEKEETTNQQLTIASEALVIVKAGKKQAIKNLEDNKNHVKPGFYFDVLTAEQVPAGSYTPAVDTKDSFLKKITTDIVNILNDVEDLEIDFDVLTAHIKAIKNDFKQLMQAIENGEDFDKIVADAVTLYEGVIKILDDLNAIEDDVKKLITNLKTLILDFIIAAIKSFENIKQLKAFLQDLQTLTEGYEYIINGYVCYEKEMTIQPETTDNFGNRLIHKNTYIPAILAISDNASVEENLQFSNALSDFQKTQDFTYKATNISNFINYKN